MILIILRLLVWANMNSNPIPVGKKRDFILIFEQAYTIPALKAVLEALPILALQWVIEGGMNGYHTMVC